MKHLYNKLKSRRGASMLFALLVFFLCLLAGVAALTAAAANAGRHTHFEGQQQQYLSVASALELLQAGMDEAADPAKNGALTVTATCVETEEWEYVGGILQPSPPPERHISLTFPTTGTEPNYFQYLLLKNSLPAGWDKALEDLFLTHTPPVWSDKALDISLEPPAGSAFNALPYPVHVTLTNDGYTLEMHLSTKEDNAYPLTAVWSGEPKVTTTVSTATTGSAAKGTRTTTTELICSLHWYADKRTVTFG